MNSYVRDFSTIYMSRQAIHKYSKYVYGDGADDYLQVFRDQINAFKNEDQRIRLSLIICLCLLIIAIYVLMLKIEGFHR